MTTTATITTTTTGSPESVLDVEAHHLSITRIKGEASHNVHLMADGDISVKLSQGGESIGTHAEGLVLIALDVDGDHDEISVDYPNSLGGMIEALHEAREAIDPAILGARRVRDA